MKLIVRADDFGYTDIYNKGTIEAIENGIVTHAEIMFDTPGTIDSLEKIKEYPWISVGWHAHFWGRPVLDPTEVPSMVNEEGRFKFRKDQSLKQTCNFEEVLKESRAQMELCISIIGRAPDVAGIQNNDSPFEKARKQVCDEYGIKYNFFSKPDFNGVVVPCLDQYKDLEIYMPNQPATVYQVCYDDSYMIRKQYDPVAYYLNDEGNILDKKVAITAWHPGYLDPYILNESRMGEVRVVDVDALCSPVLKKWIIENKVELINMRDALYDTNEYQNYLRSINSPLYIKK